jgi:hypothetical protein
VEKELTGREEEPSELIYFKVYKSQIPVIERAIEMAAMMLGTEKSRGYCLEMICADFLAGAHLDNGDPEILLHSISRYYEFLPGEQQHAFRIKTRLYHPRVPQQFGNRLRRQLDHVMCQLPPLASSKLVAAPDPPLRVHRLRGNHIRQPN